MNLKVLRLIVFSCLLIVVVRGKSVSIGSGFQTQTLTKRIKTHSEQQPGTAQNEDKNKTIGENSVEKSNVKAFLKWKLYVQLKLNHRVKSISHIETPSCYKTGARMRKTLPKYITEFN